MDRGTLFLYFELSVSGERQLFSILISNGLYLSRLCSLLSPAPPDPLVSLSLVLVQCFLSLAILLSLYISRPFCLRFQSAAILSSGGIVVPVSLQLLLPRLDILGINVQDLRIAGAVFEL